MTHVPPVQFGPYSLLELLGRGGMAEVFKASLERESRTVVIKRILPAYANHPTFIDMMTQEADIGSALNHPNIVQVERFGRIDSLSFLCLEYVHGADLMKLLATCSRKKLFLPSDLVAALIRDVAQGLDHAHNAVDKDGNSLGIIHRDINPGNILISYQGAVKLTDFGIARTGRVREGQAPVDSNQGSCGYMSPEMVTGRDFDHRSDIFSLGVLLFEAVTRKHLFLVRDELQTLLNVRDCQVEARLEKHPYIPTALQDIIRKATRQNPKDRYESAGALAADLSLFLKSIDSPADGPALGAFLQSALGWTQSAKTHEPGQTLSRVDHRDKVYTPTSLSPHANKQFYVRGTQERSLERVSHEVLRRMIVHGAISVTDLVSEDGTTWGSVEDLIKKSDFVAPQRQSSRTLAKPEGHASIISLPFALYQLSAMQRTGSLLVMSDSSVFELILRSGNIESVRCNDPSLRFGAFLVSLGLISQSQANHALSLEQNKTERLGVLLEDNGYITTKTLNQSLEKHKFARMEELLQIEQGWFGFYETEQTDHRPEPKKETTSAYLTRLLRNRLDEALLTQIFSSRMDEPILDLENNVASWTKLGLSPQEQSVAKNFEDHSTLRQLLKTPSRPQDILWTAFILFESRALAFKGELTPFGHPNKPATK